MKHDLKPYKTDVVINCLPKNVRKSVYVYYSLFFFLHVYKALSLTHHAVTSKYCSIYHDRKKASSARLRSVYMLKTTGT